MFLNAAAAAVRMVVAFFFCFFFALPTPLVLCAVVDIVVVVVCLTMAYIGLVSFLLVVVHIRGMFLPPHTHAHFSFHTYYFFFFFSIILCFFFSFYDEFWIKKEEKKNIQMLCMQYVTCFIVCICSHQHTVKCWIKKLFKRSSNATSTWEGANFENIQKKK